MRPSSDIQDRKLLHCACVTSLFLRPNALKPNFFSSLNSPCSSLSRSSYVSVECLARLRQTCVMFQRLEASTTRATVLADYRILWLELSHLASQTGIAFCYMYGFYLLHHFFMLTLSTYATLSDTLMGTFGNNIPVATCVFISSFMIFTVCEGANGVVLKVSSFITFRCSWG